MKKNYLTLLSSLVLFLFCANVHARNIVFKQALSVTQIQVLVEKLNYPEGTLVVMDDADALMKQECESPSACIYLGSPVWREWQKSLLEKEPESKYLVANTTEGIDEVASYLLKSSRVTFAESETEEVLRFLASKGVHLLVQTEKGETDKAALKERLMSLNVGNGEDSESLAGLIKENAFLNDGEDFSVYKKECTPVDAKPLTYEAGVLYANSGNKAKVLKCIVDKYNFEADKNAKSNRIKNVIFLDDNSQNASDLYYAYRGDRRHNVFALSYTALKQYKSEFLTGVNSTELQERAHQQWLEVKAGFESRK